MLQCFWFDFTRPLIMESTKFLIVSAVAIRSNLDRALRRMNAAVAVMSRVAKESLMLLDSETAMLWHLIFRLPSEPVYRSAD